MGLQFNGNRSGRQEITFGPDDSFDGLSQGTIMAWVKSAGTSGFRCWFHTSQNGQCAWPIELGVFNGQFAFWGGGSGCSATLESYAPIPGLPTDWHHLAYVSDSSGNKFYVDGQPQTPNYVQGTAATRVFFAQTATGVTKYEVGASEYAPETFDGIVDEVRVYPVALTQAQIQAAMGVSFCAPPTPTPTATPLVTGGAGSPLVSLGGQEPSGSFTARKPHRASSRRCASKKDCVSSARDRHQSARLGTIEAKRR